MSYDELVAKGDELRSRDLAEEAISAYRQALDLGGPKDRHVKQMIGVCYKVADNYEEALNWYEKAMDGASPEEKANILRDRGEALGKLGRHDEAKKDLHESLSILSDDGDKAAQGATVGFIGRQELREGNDADALARLQEADSTLSEADNPKLELYNKIHLAGALAINGKPELAKDVAENAAKLADEHGSEKHKERIQFIKDNADNPQAIRDELK